MTEEKRHDRHPATDETGGREVAPRAVGHMLVGAARQFASRHKAALRQIMALAVVGAFLGGGFVWSWHGDWSDSGNPFAWNSAARSDFFSSLLLGGILGAATGLVIAAFSRRGRTR